MFWTRSVTLMRQKIMDNSMTYQLANACNHQRNRAEKATQTFKSHLISILCGTDSSFPIRLWDRLLPQAEDTLNMLTTCSVVPTILAYTYSKGQHNYNAHPFAPMGCKVEMYIMPNVWETWAPRTVAGYYLGTVW